MVVRRVYKSLFMAVIFLIGYAVYGCVFNGGQSYSQQAALATSGNIPFPAGLPPFPVGLPSRLIGKNVSELVANRGEPNMVLETSVSEFVIYGDTYTVMYVYKSSQESGYGCTDAYVVDHESEAILTYNCH